MSHPLLPKPKYKIGDMIVFHLGNFPEAEQGIIESAGYFPEEGIDKEWHYVVSDGTDSKEKTHVWEHQIIYKL